jgi:hypothetical protein
MQGRVMVVGSGVSIGTSENVLLHEIMKVVRERAYFRPASDVKKDEIKVVARVKVQTSGSTNKRRGNPTIQGAVEESDFRQSIFPIHHRALRVLEDKAIRFRSVRLENWKKSRNSLVFMFSADR